jgi:SAM-dependent methyltransferase
MRTQKCEEEVARWLSHATIRRPSKDGPKPRFLEIGGGRGYLQAAARKAGWETLGLEMSSFAIQAALAKGLSVLPVPVDVFGLKYVPYHRYFDLIAFFDFLEHVPDPARLLRVVRELLADQGTIIFRVPVIDDGQLPSLHLIDHLWHFSAQTLKRLLDKEGFEVYHDHDSGRFTDPDGVRFIQNWTFYARKAMRGNG